MEVWWPCFLLQSCRVWLPVMPTWQLLFVSIKELTAEGAWKAKMHWIGSHSFSQRTPVSMDLPTVKENILSFIFSLRFLSTFFIYILVKHNERSHGGCNVRFQVCTFMWFKWLWLGPSLTVGFLPFNCAHSQQPQHFCFDPVCFSTNPKQAVHSFQSY